MNRYITNTRNLVFLCLTLTVFMFSLDAKAVVSCSATSSLPASAYVVTAATNMTGSVTVTCTRNAADLSDPSTGYVRAADGSGVVSFSLGADGVNLGATIALSGTDQLNYRLERAPSTSQWTNATANKITGIVNFGIGQTSSSTSTSFVMNVPAGGARWGSPAGVYTELVTVFLTYGSSTATTSFTNTVTVSSICIFPTAPVDLDFGTYSSLAAGPALAATSAFTIRCTSGVAFSFSFDAVTSIIPSVNLNYSLTSPAGGTSAGNVLSRNIVGSMPSTQSGTCNTASCAGSQPRTLILSY
jgi:hypothetical protein